MPGETFAQQLRAWRARRGLSLRGLAELVSYDHTYLWELETGRKPPSRPAAQACDRALGAGGQLQTLVSTLEQNGKTTADPMVDATGLEFSAEWREGVGEAVQLWQHDAERRQVLRTSAFTAAGFAGPVVRWLTSDQADRPDGNGPVRVGPPDVATIRETTATWRRLDNRYGGGQAREAAVSFLHHQVAPLLRDGHYDQPVGAALLSATAELTVATGWMTYDCGLHGLAQRYFIQALRLARAGADTALGAEILAAMSHQAVYLRRGAEGVDLAGAARRAAIKAGVPALVAEAQVMAAHAHASLGAERACTTALTAAETTLSRADRARDPQWIGYFDHAYLAAKIGHCLAALSRGAHAEQHARRSLDMNGAYVRGKVFNLVLLANTYLNRPHPEPEQAATTGTHALGLARQLRSARATGYLTDLADRLAPYAGQASVDAFRTAVAGLLAVEPREQYGL